MAKKKLKEETEIKSVSIKSNPKNRAKKRAQYLRNKAARAAHYTAHQGQISMAQVPGWHRTLDALSKGTL